MAAKFKGFPDLVIYVLYSTLIWEHWRIVGLSLLFLFSFSLSLTFCPTVLSFLVSLSGSNSFSHLLSGAMLAAIVSLIVVLPKLLSLGKYA